VTFYDAAIQARARLQEAGISPDTATRDADLLARHALGWDLATWLARRREPASSAFLDTYDAIIRRRVNREPVAYIRGVQEFWGRDFRVATGVLIPRPETELLIELAGDYLRDHPGAAIIDVGTGSGCIAITLALEHPAATVHATDISSAALAIAAANASRLGAKVNFIQASLLDSAPRPMNLIVSNPPSVAERDKPGLSREVRDYEPDVALYGGTDGWREIRALLRATPTVLADDGLLLMELGYGQSEQLANEVEQVDSLFVDHIHADLQGIPRVAVIRRRRSDASATE
jgi:release factor glutamine methyltransferase